MDPDFVKNALDFPFDMFKTEANSEFSLAKLDPVLKFVAKIWVAPKSAEVWYKEGERVTKEKIHGCFVEYQYLELKVSTKEAVGNEEFWRKVSGLIYDRKTEKKGHGGMRTIQLFKKEAIRKSFITISGGVDPVELDGVFQEEDGANGDNEELDAMADNRSMSPSYPFF